MFRLPHHDRDHRNMQALRSFRPFKQLETITSETASHHLDDQESESQHELLVFVPRISVHTYDVFCHACLLTFRQHCAALRCTTTLNYTMAPNLFAGSGNNSWPNSGFQIYPPAVAAHCPGTNPSQPVP